MRSFAPGWGDARRSLRPPTRLLLLLVLLPLVAGLFTAAPAAPIVRADDLQGAIAQKDALSKQVAAQKAAIAQLNAMQAALKVDIASTKRQLSQVNADLGAMQHRIDDMNAQIAKVQAAYDSLVSQLIAVAAQIPRIQAEEKVKADQLAARKALLAQRIRDAYATGQTSLLETFLSSASFTDILTEMGYQIDMGKQDEALAEQIQQDQATLAQIHQSLLDAQAQTLVLRDATAAQKAELDQQLAGLQTAKAQLKQLQAQTAKTLAAQRAAYQKSQANAAAAQRALAQAAAAQRALQAKIDDLIRQQAAKGNIPSQYNGTFIWEPPYGSCAHYHPGIDIVAPYGTPVKAAGDGTVVYVGWNYADGPDPAWIVVIAHSSSLRTWYAHMTGKTPAGNYAGATVHQGDVIGYEGSTGHSTGAHLHWAVQLDGNMVNPRLFL
jgi:murein DD-endopeptidase MepM/ murein hydrolase activator NlpD